MNYRFVKEDEIEIVLKFIKKLAMHENRPQDVTITHERLYKILFVDKLAEVVLAEFEGKVVGYAFFYSVVGSYSGNVRMYLEDFYLDSFIRGKGLGKEFMIYLANLALDRGYSGMQWSALNDNIGALNFYNKIGAEIESGRVHFDFDKDKILNFVNK